MLNSIKIEVNIINQFLKRKEDGQKILFSELLDNIPSDEVLAELFSFPDDSSRYNITHFGLEILKLRLKGYVQSQIIEELQTTKGRVSYWSSLTKHYLSRYMPECFEIDIPGLRKLLCMKQLPCSRYTKLSELLREMPSDEELYQLDEESGNTVTTSPQRKRVTHKDLYILQQRLAGRSNKNIGEEFGWSPKEVHRHIQATRKRLIRDLRIELDVPQLFKPFKLEQRR